MTEEYIERLIDSIVMFDKLHKPPYFILFYLPTNEEHGRYEDVYFSVLAITIKPTEEMMEDILYQSKKQIGNMIYAAEYEILTKDAAIEHLEASIN